MGVRVELLELVTKAKRCYAEKDLDGAYKAWCEIYDTVENLEQKNEVSVREYHTTMSLFSDEEVYGITDYGKAKEGV